jgi:predicted nucleic acid-binding protein
MKLFIDANIIVSVLNKEYPLFTVSSRILSLAGWSGYEVFTSPVCLAIAFYFAEKKHGTTIAKQKIDTLCNHISIAANSEISVRKSLHNPSIHDFEDGLEYYAALENKCKCIITENIKDFYFSEIEVLSSEDFCKKYLLKRTH